jgi:glycosyltransferase involved in cell wall biosynthesis
MHIVNKNQQIQTNKLFPLLQAMLNEKDYPVMACINRIRPTKPALVATLHGCVAHEIRLQLKTIHKSSTFQMAREYLDRLEQIGAASAEYTILANEWMRDILIDEFKIPSKKLKVFHYGNDIESFMIRMEMKSEVERQSNKKVILYTGRLVEQKGVQHLLDALKRLKDKRQDWVCWIAGDGDMRRSSASRVKC